MKSKSGFTIIEVIVVIGIIAVLTIIIFPALNDIRKKNKDTERIADIASLQLGLALYKNQNPAGAYYPTSLDSLVPTYVPNDTILDPNGVRYTYIPLNKSSGNKCTYYHLGTTLDLPSGQIDSADNFTSYNLNAITNGYQYCGTIPNGLNNGLSTSSVNYNVHP